MTPNHIPALVRELSRKRDLTIEDWLNERVKEYGLDFAFTDVTDQFSTEQGGVFLRFLQTPDGDAYAGRMARQALLLAVAKDVHRRATRDADVWDTLHATFRDMFAPDADRKATSREHNDL